jgi:spermidine synthase
MPYFPPSPRLTPPGAPPGTPAGPGRETLGSPYVEVYERRAGENGELVLRGDGRHFEIISNGVFLMDTRAGESERLLVRAALERVARPADVLIGGLGVGFSLAEALASPLTRAVTVIEREPAVIGWHATLLRRYSGGALGADGQPGDDRVRVERADLLGWLRATTETFDVICLDIDNGPEWTVTEGNAALYGPAGLELLAGRLRPGGALAVWSAAAAPAFAASLRERFKDVSARPVRVARGEPDVVYLASTRSA